jgi:Rrf2 family protein
MRLELTRKTDLALRAFRVLAAADGLVPGRALAEAVGTTLPFVAQVMAPLVRAGLAASRPGPRGGYSLASDPRTVSVLAVVDAVEGPIDPAKCVLVGGPCGAPPCSVHQAWGAARSALEDALRLAPALE